MCMMDEIRVKRDEIYAIARKHKAEKLWAFGSCARKEELLNAAHVSPTMSARKCLKYD